MKLNESILMVARHLRNAFEISAESGAFAIVEGEISPVGEYCVNEWIAITGSKFNNGIYKIVLDNPVHDSYQLGNGTDSDNPVADEQFVGTVWRLMLPKDLVDVCKEVAEWMDSKLGKPSNVASESVAGYYSVTMMTDKNGNPAGWESVFASRLNGMWRKMFASVLISSL